MTRSLSALLVCACLSACPKRVPRNYPIPSSEHLLAHVAGVKERVKSINAETRSEVWQGGKRVKFKMFMMAAWGGRLRFMAMAPNDANVADLASDGQTYCFRDVKKNCGECGPATAQNVARLTGVVLEPDEIVAALFGSTPVLGSARVSAHRWDSKHGREVLTLASGNVSQRLELDGRDKRWDVVKSVMIGADGKTAWSITHFDFHNVKTIDGGQVRLPATSRIQQGKTDLSIKWRDVRVNDEPVPAKFKLTLHPGLPPCG